MIKCCEFQSLILSGKTIGLEDRFICECCGTILTESTTEKDPIIMCGDKEYENLRKNHIKSLEKKYGHLNQRMGIDENNSKIN